MDPILLHLHGLYQQIGCIRPPPVDAPPPVHATHLELLTELHGYASQLLQNIFQWMKDTESEPNADVSVAFFSSFCKDSGGVISTPPIPVGFQSVLWIPVEFISQNFTPAMELCHFCIYIGMVPGFQSPKSSDRIGAKKYQIWKFLHFHMKNSNKIR